MVDPTCMLLGGGTAGLGMDAGIVVATAEMTNYIKERCEEWNLTFVKRFYTFIPFLAAFVLCFTMVQDPIMAAQHGFKYGLAAIFGWNVWKKSVKGA